MRLFDFLWLVPAAQAFKIPFEVHHVPDKSSGLDKSDETPVKNMANSVYVSNITLGSTPLPVMLDTGRLAAPTFNALRRTHFFNTARTFG